MYGTEALRHRNIGNRVRQTASLISGHRHIRERQSHQWACDMEERIIFWTAYHPMKDENTPISDDYVFVLTVHEASHLEISGGFDVPEPPVVDSSARFFRFWNCVEDIRIENWAMDKFPGIAPKFKMLYADLNRLMLETCKDKSKPEIHIADQVGLNYIYKAKGLDEFGSKECKKFVKETYPEIEDIFLTSKSSAEVAERILPIYQKLMKEQPDQMVEEEPEIILIGSGDGMYRSTDSNGGKGKVLTLKELLDGIADDAKGETKKKLKVFIAKREAIEKTLQKIAESGIGNNASGFESSSYDWEKCAHDNRGRINVLSRRLEAKLQHNAADAWDTRLKRGKFDSGKAYRSVRGDNRIFKKRHAIGKCDYDFLFTVDVSGSQMGRSEEILAASVIFCEAVENADMGLAIITWDAEVRHYKRWGSTLSSCERIIGADLACPTGGTYEAHALRVAEDMIRPRLELERSVVLITITDGATVYPNESESIMDDLNARGVKSIGIGVQCEAPTHYKIRLSVDSGEELGVLLPNLLNDVVKRG